MPEKPSEIKKLLKNIKGVIKVTSLKNTRSDKLKYDDKKWMEMVEKLAGSVDPSEIDMKDERTRYIMGER